MEGHLSNPTSFWMTGDGHAADVVLSSRIRLARNLEPYSFPEHLDAQQGDATLKAAAKAVKRLGGSWEFMRMADLKPLDRRVLVEKHLISPQHAQGGPYQALALTADESQSIMFNEEDHIRLQCIWPGLALDAAWNAATGTDDTLEENLDYAFDAERGYLAACPTNLGTGLRASVMMHLGGLTLTNQVSQLVTTLGKLGLAVRGLYGEGSQASGQLFQISNAVTLGHTEEEIVQGLAAVASQVLEQERAARQHLVQRSAYEIGDRVERAYGILRHAMLLGGQEALALLSDVRLGVEVNLLSGPPRGTINQLLILSLPASLERAAGHALSTREEMRSFRAKLIRERLRATERS